MANSSDKLLHDLEYRFSALMSARKTGGKPATGRQAQHASASTTQAGKHNTHRRAHHRQANTTRIGEPATCRRMRERRPRVSRLAKRFSIPRAGRQRRLVRRLSPRTESREDSTRLSAPADSPRQQTCQVSPNSPSVARPAGSRPNGPPSDAQT